MKLQDKITIHKAITTSREFFQDNIGIKCVHYGDIYKNYSGKTVLSSNIINSFVNDVQPEKILYCDSIIVPDVTETVSDWGHFTYIKYDGVPYINGTHAIALTSNSVEELKYLFRYLSSNLNRKRLQTLLNGSTVFQISIKDFNAFSLENYHNEPTEQSHIVDILGSIDEKIEFCDKQKDLYIKLGKAIYEKIIRSATDNISFEKLFTFTNGYSFKSKDYIQNGTHKVITIKNITESGFYADTADTINFCMDFKKQVLSVGDILLTMTGEVGRSGIVCEENCLLNQRVLKVDSFSRYFSYFTLLFYSEEIKSLAKGSVQQNLGLKELNKMEIPFSKKDDYSRHDIIISKLIETEKHKSKLKELKQLYLKKFFS